MPPALRVERDTVVYRLERGRAASTGQFYEARLPEALAGSISALISQKHLATFAAERAAILEAGLQTTRYQQLNDTGLRGAGVNHDLSVLTNPHFACLDAAEDAPPRPKKRPSGATLTPSLTRPPALSCWMTACA